jgi:hypothetical protein
VRGGRRRGMTGLPGGGVRRLGGRRLGAALRALQAMCPAGA